MTMLDFYKLSINDSKELRKKVESEGRFIKQTEQVTEHYRPAIIYEYNGDTFKIDSYLGIIDINDTAKEIKF